MKSLSAITPALISTMAGLSSAHGVSFNSSYKVLKDVTSSLSLHIPQIQRDKKQPFPGEIQNYRVQQKQDKRRGLTDIIAEQKKKGTVMQVDVRGVPHMSLREKQEGPKTDLLIIVGAGSGISYDLALEWLRGGSHRNIVFLTKEYVTQEEMSEFEGRVRFIHADKEEYRSPEILESLLKRELEVQGPLRKLALVSSKGCADPRDGYTLEDINVYPLVNTARALCAHADKAEELTLINSSSIAATILKEHSCAYVDSRLEADRTMMQIAQETKKSHPHLKACTAMVFRSGVFLGGLEEAFPWRLPSLVCTRPYQVVPGSGNQIIPLAPVSDLVKAMVTGIEVHEEGIIDVVPENLPQFQEVLDYFATFVDNKQRRIHLPLEIMRVVSREFSYGGMAEYTGMIFTVMDSRDVDLDRRGEKYRKLLGRKSLTLQEMFPSDKDIITTKPPLRKHAQDALNKCIQDPRKAFKVIRVVIKYSPQLVEQLVRATFSLKEKKPPMLKTSEYTNPFIRRGQHSSQL